MLRTDVFVVGGGPAGLAAAIAARRQGFRVLVADCATPPIDKACGEGLMPDSVCALRQLGVELDLREAAVLKGIRFIEGRRRIEAQFPDGVGVAVRRTSLQQQLVDQARSLGVKMLWAARKIDVDGTSVTVEGEAVQTEFVIGADGQRSQVRRAAGLDRAWYESVRYGFRQHFRMSPWSDHVEVYWTSGAQIYVTPVRENEVGVALVSNDAKLRTADAIRKFPELERRLRSGVPCSMERGGLTMCRRLRKVWRGNTALTGDASGSVDCITGDGLCLAFKEAYILGKSLRDGDLAGYQRSHDRVNRRARTMTALLLMLSRGDGLRSGFFELFNRQPALFAALLGVHVGQPIGVEFGAGRLVAMGRGLMGV